MHNSIHDKVDGALGIASMTASIDAADGPGVATGMKIVKDLLAMVDNATANVERLFGVKLLWFGILCMIAAGVLGIISNVSAAPTQSTLEFQCLLSNSNTPTRTK